MLDRADNIMETDSYAAMDILDSIPRSTLSGADSARFALLYTQAQIKNWIKVDSDTLIDHAYNYYKDHDQGTLTIRAYFYKAKVAYNRGDMRASMRDVLPAYEMAKEHNNPYWIAKTAELIADIFYDVYNYPQAEEYRKKVIENYIKAKATSNIFYAKCDLATIYLNHNQISKADSIITELYNEIEHSNIHDDYLLKYIDDTKAVISISKGEIPENYTPFKPDVDTNSQIEEYIRKAEISNFENQHEKAIAILDSALSLVSNKEQKGWVLYEKFKINYKKGDFQKASSLTDTLLNLQGSLTADIINESVTNVQREFYSQKAISSQRNAKTLKLIITIITISTIIIVALLIIIFYIRIKQRRLELEETLSSLDNLRQETSKLNSENKLVIESLFRNQWKTLNLLCNEYFEKADNETTRRVLLNNLEKELLKLRSERNLQLMEKEVNLYLDNIMTKLRSQCPNLQSDDYTFLMLNFAGLSLRAICFFTGIKYKTFHNKKMRLIRRIEASDAQDKAIFLKQLGVST